MHFRSWLRASMAAALASLMASAAGAHGLIDVDENSQQMTVSVRRGPYHARSRRVCAPPSDKLPQPQTQARAAMASARPACTSSMPVKPVISRTSLTGA